MARLAPEAKVVRWSNAHAALEAIEAGMTPIPDIMFIDLNLPGMSGRDFLRQMRTREYYKIVPAMILSANSESDDVRQSFLDGASGHLVKPTGFDKLSGLLSRCLSYWFETTRHPLNA